MLEAQDQQPHAADIVVQRLVGFSARLTVDEHGISWLASTDGQPMPSLLVGERIRVLTGVPGDATYARLGRVQSAPQPDMATGRWRCRVEIEGETEREQQRRHVRVPTPPIDVNLMVLGDDASTAIGDLLNLSAGGIRAATEADDLQIGMPVKCHFELPGARRGTVEVDLHGEVVWLGKGPAGQAAVGVRFTDADEAVEAKLAGWVLRQQTKGSA